MIAKYGLLIITMFGAFLSVLFDDSLIPEQDDDVLIYTKNTYLY